MKDKRWTVRLPNNELPAVTLRAPNNAAARMAALAHWVTKYAAKVQELNIFSFSVVEENIPGEAMAGLAAALENKLGFELGPAQGIEEYGDEELLRAELAQIHAGVMEPMGTDHIGSLWDDWLYRALGMRNFARSGGMGSFMPAGPHALEDHPEPDQPSHDDQRFDELTDRYVREVLRRFGLDYDVVAVDPQHDVSPSENSFTRTQRAFMDLYTDMDDFEAPPKKPIVIVRNDDELNSIFIEMMKLIIGFEEARHRFEQKDKN